MRKLIAILVAVATFALPGVASAHSGHVTCGSTGVVFTYDANFPVTTTATEHVNGVNYTFVVAPNVVNTHTVPAPATNPFIASATWVGGGTIAPTTLTCPVVAPPVPPVPPVVPPVPPTPVPPAPPVVPPTITCPPNTVDLGMSGGVKLCGIVTPPKPPPFAMCPKGSKSTGVHNGVLVCLKTQIKIKVKVITKIKWVQWCPLPPKCKNPEGCVAG